MPLSLLFASSLIFTGELVIGEPWGASVRLRVVTRVCAGLEVSVSRSIDVSQNGKSRAAIDINRQEKEEEEEEEVRVG